VKYSKKHIITYFIIVLRMTNSGTEERKKTSGGVSRTTDIQIMSRKHCAIRDIIFDVFIDEPLKI
jgi:hypothetical protein